MKAAVTALNDLLSPERCAQLVEAIIKNFVALTPEELQEWQVMPSMLCALAATG